MQKRIGVFLLTVLLLVMLLVGSTTIAHAEAGLSIISQPESTTVYCGETAEVFVSAVGEDLQYKWYYKNKGSSKFTLTDTFTSDTYFVAMNDSRDGRMIYCVITDKYGNSVQTDKVILSMTHEYDEGVLTKEATCNATGARVYTCQRCRVNHTELINPTEHDMGQWSVYKEATASAEGVERASCKNCSYYDERVIAKLDAAFYITVNTDKSESYKVAVDASGKYKLDEPKRKGYVFNGWVDSSGNAFANEGTISADTEVKAQWALDGTDTIYELVDRVQNGVDKILITSNIVVDRPIYVSYNTTIYSDGDYSIIRAADYDGDIFVVGVDENGISAINHDRKAVLNIGGGKGTLTIDGNRDNVTVDVVGSLVFASHSATINIYDGARIANNKKVGNERSFDCVSYVDAYTTERAGGAGVLNIGATINMYGGIIENNLVSTVHTEVVNEDGTVSTSEINGCGGGVFSNGNMYMYGGIIRGNEALRGGGVFVGRVSYFKSGTISDNIAHYYGGGISTASTMYSDTYLGTTGEGNKKMILSGNHSYRAGGAIYSNTSSPIIIYANTEIINNISDTSGGGIYTAGPVTARGAVFKGNFCELSGGAIYHHYTKADFDPRLIQLYGCLFEENTSSLGGAITLSASDAVAETGKGTQATITDCEFLNNKTFKGESNDGNGGAIYITRKSKADISNCKFIGNTAATNSGAVSIHSNATVTLSNCSFEKNTARFGGAMYTSSNATVDFNNVTFSENKAVVNESGSGGNGGALYIYDANVKWNNVDFYNNEAANNGGACYLGVSDLRVDVTCDFKGNTALGHGGAFYLTYKTLEDGTKDGAVLTAIGTNFENNTALAGGAISIRTDCKANLTNVKLIGNTATSTGESSFGGGAVYVGFGTLNLDSVTATGNSSAFYGGVIDSVASTVSVINSNFSENTAISGGAIKAISASTVTVENSVFTKNESAYENTEYNGDIGGGAIGTNGGTLTVSGSTFDGNKSGYYGGAIHTNKTQVTINGNTKVTNSVGATGAALFFKNGSQVSIQDVEITNNTSNGNGVVYANGSTLNMSKVVVSGNSANNGGVLYISGGSTQATLSGSTWSNNTAKVGGAIYISNASVVCQNMTFTENTANTGGAIYNENGSLLFIKASFTNNHAVKTASGSSGNGGAIVFSGGTMSSPGEITFSNNTAEGNGGAIYMNATTITVDRNFSFIGNTAGNHGGAIYLTYKTLEDGTRNGAVLNAYGTKFENNTALGGGAISARTDCEANLNNLTLSGNKAIGFADKDDGDGEGGGAIYVGYGKLSLNNVIATGNTSTGFGGAINSVGSTVTITNGDLSSNEALYGGAINALTKSDVTINGTTFTANKSVYDNTDYDGSKGGGAISIKGGSLNITGATFDSNSSDYYGGTILANGTTVVIDGNTVVKNSIGSTGSALHFRGAFNATLTDVSILDNKDGYNGVIYANGGTLEMTNVTANGNSATNGGVLFISGSGTKVTVKNCNFTNNSASKGGAVSLSSGTLNIADVLFDTNTASTGGAVYNEKGTLIITDTTFTANSATKNGGAIALAGGSLAVSGNTEFTSNNAAGDAGAVYVSNFTDDNDALTHSTASFAGTSFSENTANYGGAISVSPGCSASIEDTSFTSNSSVKNGGAVYVYNAELQVNGGNTFSNNTSSNHGGAICLSGSTMTAAGENTFNGNKAANHGGAIYVTYTSGDSGLNGSLTMTDGTFSGNTALGGGAVSVRSNCDASFNGTVFENNKSEGFAGEDDGDGEGGGAIYVGYGKLSLNNVIATGNTSTGFGGAVDIVGATVNITNGDISDNDAVNSGAIYAMSKSNVTINGTTFTNNKSTFDNTTSDGNKGGGAISIKGGTLTISGATFDSNFSDYYGGTILANGTTVVINGNTVVKNSVGKTGSALHFRGACKVTVEDVSILDNTGAVNGVIYVNGGTCDMTNVTVSGNEGVNGVIYASGKSTVVTINKCDFNNNTATNGTIYAKEATVTVTDSQFSKNTASNGGAIYTLTGNVTVNNSTFTENTASIGGAIYTNESAVFTVNGSEFKNNSAILGGAIYTKASTVELKDSTFTSNTAKKNSSGANGNGGAMVISASTVTASGNNTFIGNTAENHGGAIYVTYTENEDKTTNPGVLTMTDGYFEGNSAVAGGAISSRTNCEVTLTGTELKGNSASGKDAYEGGGAIYSNNNTLTLSGVILDGNSSAYYGGAVAAPGANVTIKDNSVIKNNVGVTGVALYFRDSGTYTLTDVSVTNNIASSNGSGVIYLTGSCTGNFTNLTASGNKNNNGGVIYTSGNVAVTLTDSDLSNNTALSYGGAIDHRASGMFEITNTKLSGNTAKNGGAIYTTRKVTIDGCEITSNSATEKGGAVYVNGSSANVTVTGDTALSNNTANYGGAIYNDLGLVNLNGATFISNSAAKNGGAVVVAGGTLNATGNNIFASNKADNNSGAVYATYYIDDNDVRTYSTVSFTGGIFSENTSETGGAMVVSSGCSVSLDGTSFTKNSASTAGAIYAGADSELTLSNTNFESNSTNGNGGAIYVSNAELTLNGGNTFSKNTTPKNGGAIYLAGSTMTASGNNLFTENTAANHGGAIYVVYTTNEDKSSNPAILTMTDGTFTSNSALGGGAVSVRSGCEASFNGTVFENNSVSGFANEDDGDGEGGGAVYVGFGTVNLTDAILNGNTSTGFGGAVNSMSSTVNVTNGEFSDNSALYGGAIYSQSKSNVTVNGATFTANKSTYVNSDYDGNKGGGAISIKGGTLTVSDATFDANGSDYYGGTILANGTTVVINGNTVVKNSIGKTGSALHFRGSSKVTMEDVSILDNKDASNGVIYANGGTLEMTNVTASGNSASSGGVLFVSGASTNVTVNNSTFSGNSASKGGVISLTNGTLTINGSTFTSNTATTGGAVYNEKGTLTVTDTTFTSNSATKNGGAIGMAGGTLTVSGNTSFKLNTADNYAGAVYVSSITDDKDVTTYSTATFTGGIFEENTAPYGGAIYISAGCTVNTDGTSFIKNNATTNGGAIYQNANSKLEITNTSFTQNSAKSNGGAVSVNDAEFILNNGNTFTSNTAGGHGGAVYLTASPMTATGKNIFEENTAVNHGGAIYLTYYNLADGTKDAAVLTADGAEFKNNKAMCGGAISIRTACEANLTNVTLTGNTVEGNDGTDDGNGEGGGAIYVG